MQIKSQDSALQAKSLESAELSKPYGPAGSNGFRPTSPIISTAVDALSEASHELRGVQAQLVERVTAARRSLEGYVHAQPWKAVAIGAGLSAALGVVLGLLFAPRS